MKRLSDPLFLLGTAAVVMPAPAEAAQRKNASIIVASGGSPETLR